MKPPRMGWHCTWTCRQRSGPGRGGPAGRPLRLRAARLTADLASITGMNAPTELLIGGQWSAGRAGLLPVIDPATEDPIAEVASATPDDAIDAVDAAHQALPGWAATAPRAR